MNAYACPDPDYGPSAAAMAADEAIRDEAWSRYNRLTAEQLGDLAIGAQACVGTLRPAKRLLGSLLQDMHAAGDVRLIRDSLLEDFEGAVRDEREKEAA